ncbi:F-box/kelch-repeat protein At3g61590-like isoform X2 [Phalaenopsis equestris]|uniref:F-box/kelch-repeat protein At3g61590-like isoform X2 n=1 Tax=Phalaenopsis equestris TaxID=78828 RepID=UPI0009E4ECCC|nr:F-box/kelch-repeat protein At3g61590-like isoform X2 [Phalaenopsis equestris]
MTWLKALLGYAWRKKLVAKDEFYFVLMSMEEGTSHQWQNSNELRIRDSKLDLFSKENDQRTEISSASFNTILPDDILEKIFSFLPVLGIIRAGSVCKRWHEVVHSGKYSWSRMPPQRPWYFMFTHSKNIVGYAYDSTIKKWYNFNFPCLDKCNWFISSSCGLVCFMDYENRNRILVCNPITRDWKQLQQPPNGKSPDYSALALSVDRFSLSYTVAVVKSNQIPHDFLQWEFTIHIYESENCLWVASINEVLEGWRGGDECVICNGILYCLVYSFSGNNERRHGLVKHKLRSNSPHVSLIRTMIPVPCPLTCGRLMNLRDKLVMVGGIGRHDRSDIIKGIGIWELWNEEWREVARMPQKFFQGFGELDDVFASSGADDLIFIQSYGAPALLTFDMSHKQWRWSLRCPATKRSALQLFTGFCFEPRLEMRS